MSDELIESLQGERKLLGDLARVLAHQREGVSRNDVVALDDSAFAAERVLLSLHQARKRRRTILAMMGGSEEVPLGELDVALGRAYTPSIGEARDALLEAARQVARDAERNRRVIAGAASLGEEVLALLLGHTGFKGFYSPQEGRANSSRAGVLINTQV